MELPVWGNTCCIRIPGAVISYLRYIVAMADEAQTSSFSALKSAFVAPVREYPTRKSRV